MAFLYLLGCDLELLQGHKYCYVINKFYPNTFILMVLAGLVVLSSICFAMNGKPHIHRELWILES